MITYDYLNQRYQKVISDEELCQKIGEDFGPEAVEHLKNTGTLYLNEAFRFRDKWIKSIDKKILESTGVMIPRNEVQLETIELGYIDFNH